MNRGNKGRANNANNIEYKIIKAKMDDKIVHNNDDKKCSQIMVIINVSLLACKPEK